MAQREERLRKRIREFTGRDDVLGVVHVQRWEPWANAAFLGMFAVAYATAMIGGLSPGARGALAGGFGGLAMWVGIRTVLVARFPSSVLVARCERFSTKVEVAEAELDPPVELEMSKGVVTSKATFAGSTYRVARSNSARLRELLRDG